jgi:hypothetical protein
MSVFPSEVLERARHPSASGRASLRWLLALQGALSDMEARLAARLASVHPVAAGWAQAGFADVASAGYRGLARLWAAELANAAGFLPAFAPEGPDGGLVCARGSTRAVLLDVLVSGAPEDGPVLKTLEERLAGVFSDRRWAIVLRKPLPPDLPVERVVEPVRMWLASVERGKWEGDYAIYEDGGVSVELRLLPGAPRAPGPVLRLPAVDVERRLAESTREILSAVRDVADLDPSWPRVPLVVHAGARPLPRRRRLEALYGKLIEISTAPAADTRLTFVRSSLGLYGRSEMDQVAGVWWLWPSSADPCAWTGQADENPWCAVAARGPAFTGENLAVSVVGDATLGAPASLRRVRGP